MYTVEKTEIAKITNWCISVICRGLRQVDEKISRLARRVHLSVVYPWVYRASGAYRLNNIGTTLGWSKDDSKEREKEREKKKGGRTTGFGGPRERRSTAVRLRG